MCSMMNRWLTSILAHWWIVAWTFILITTGKNDLAAVAFFVLAFNPLIINFGNNFKVMKTLRRIIPVSWVSILDCKREFSQFPPILRALELVWIYSISRFSKTTFTSDDPSFKYIDHLSYLRHPTKISTNTSSSRPESNFTDRHPQWKGFSDGH